jgi:hypothetical protein
MKISLIFWDVTARHMLLKCSETINQREDFLCTTCLSINEGVDTRK